MKNLNYNLITAELDRDPGITKFKYGDLYTHLFCSRYDNGSPLYL